MRRPFLAAILLFATTAFAAGRPIAPRPLIPSNESFHRLAVGSALGRFLTVWNVPHRGGLAIYGSISDESGHSLWPIPFLIAETTDVGTSALTVAGAGESFAVFYTDAANRVFMTDVSLDGLVLETRALDLPSTEHMSIAWNGAHFLAANFRENWYRHRGIASLLERDGTIVVTEIALDPLAAVSHTAVTDEGFIVFTSGRDHFAHVIGDDGSVRQLIAGDPASNFLSAPIGDGRLLVVYRLSDGHVRAAVWKEGAKLSEQEIVLDDPFRPVGLMPGNGRHLIVFEATEALFAFHIDDEGTPSSEPLLVQPGEVRHTANGASNGTVLFLPHRLTRESPVIASIAVKPDRTLAADDTLSIRPAAQSHVLVGAGGGSMLAAWNEAKPNTYETRIGTAAINRDFETENIRELAAYGSLAIRKMAWNGTEFLVVYQGRHGQLFAVRLAYDGEPIGEPTLLGVSDVPRAAATWAGDRWAVVWVSAYGESVIHYRTVSRGGSASPPQELDVTNNLAFDLALAFDGRNLHLGWIETAGPWYIEPPPQGHAVFTTRLRRTGRLLDATPLQLAVSPWPHNFAIACNGEQLVVLIDQASSTVAHVVSADTGQHRATRTLFDGIVRSDVTWDGSAFVAASVQDSIAGPSLLRVWHLGKDGMTTEDPRIVATPARKDLLVSIAATPSYGAVVGLQESDAANGERAVLYAEREMYRLPPP